MTNEQMAKLLALMHEEEVVTRAAGQKEYAHNEQEVFSNFMRLGAQLQMDRKKILWVFLQKHLDGILAYINGHKSQREDVRGRIKDARVYLALLRGMVEEDEVRTQL